MLNQDRELFEAMEGRFISENEKIFFEIIRYKQEHVFTFANDLILSETNNDEGLYIVRCEYEEYIVGRRGLTQEQHVMCLCEALNLNLKVCGLIDRDITLFQWLRERDYEGVEYDHNYDDI